MQPNNNIRPLRVYTAAVPKEGPLVVPYSLDFTVAASGVIDLSQLFNAQAISIIQAIYADNSANSQSMSITVPDTQQVLTWPPYSQGYLPVLQTTNFKFSYASNGNAVVKIELMNFNVAPMVWSTSGTPPLTAGGAMLVSDTTLDGAIVGGKVQTQIAGNLGYTNRSNTITAGGTAQTLMNANAARIAWQLQNISTADLWYSHTGAAAVGGSGSYKLVAGGYYESAPGLAPNGAISIIGATTGQAFTASEA